MAFRKTGMSPIPQHLRFPQDLSEVESEEDLLSEISEDELANWSDEDADDDDSEE